MGEGMYVPIAKGSVHKKVDATVNHKDAGGAFDKRAAFLADLEGAGDANAYLDVLQNPTVMASPPNGVLATLEEPGPLIQAEANYLRNTWYNEGKNGWWPWLQPIYPILKAGLIKAIQAAQNPPRPIDSYWLVGGNQVQVIVCALPGAQHVLRLILTPPGLAPTQNRPNPIQIWSIRRSPGWTQGDSTPEEIVDDVIPSGGNVVIFKQKELPTPNGW